MTYGGESRSPSRLGLSNPGPSNLERIRTMPSKIRNKMPSILLTGALVAMPSVVVAQPTSQPSLSPSSRIIARLLDRKTREPLAGEVGYSFVSAGKIIFRHAKTTGSGEIVIDGIEAGKVHLTTKLDDYAVEHQTVSLRPGEAKTLELTLVKATPLRGIVRNSAGTPLAGVTVRVHYPVEAPGIGEIRTTYQWETGETRSDAGGSFVIPLHPEKAFVVEASHPGFLRKFSAPMAMKDLGKVPAINLALDSGITLAGTVKDERGNAIPGAEVRLIEAGARGDATGFVSHALLEDRLRLSSSGADGAFRFDQVSPTAKVIVIIRPGYKPFRQTIGLTAETANVPFRALLVPQK